MNYRFIGLTAALLAIAASGCQTAKINPTAGGGGLTGAWRPDSGGYTAMFNNGRFETTALDTGNLISQGGYLVVSDKQVNLTWTSNITGLENSASCERPDADTLVCRDAGGKSFTLRRNTA